MRKFLSMFLVLGMMFALVGCNEGEASKKEDVEEIENDGSDTKKEDEKVYGIGEVIEYAEDDDVKYTFVINSVSLSEERNQFEESNPAQVVKINYSYENVNDDEDVYISSMNFTVVDGGGNVCDTYPNGGEYPQAAPKGAKSSGDEFYGLKETSTSIKLRFKPAMFGGPEVQFELPIQ
ncbi:hypothetical protein A4S06_07480 [Erysipelotrichaceae bacterium MTC7]|nr:hypothetical protein A4S06_07480 [Erysipelotrichaceae bacterium MTC7]